MTRDSVTLASAPAGQRSATPISSRGRLVARGGVAALALVAALSGLIVPLGRADRSAAQHRAPSLPVDPHPQARWEAATPRRVFHATPSGRPDNPGTAEAPIDLARALSADGPLRPGDLLWVHGGTYVGNFRSTVAGTHAAYIVVAAVPGERATLDGAGQPESVVLRVDGSHTVYWGLEVTNSAPPIVGRRRGTGIDIFGPYTKVINSVVHHTGNGIGVWTPALEAEIYGNLIHDVGWVQEGRGHGHSIYVQNDALTKHLVDNILFDGHSYGIHAFTVLGQINNLHIEGNIAFDHGSRSHERGAMANVLVGGRQLAERPVLVSNYAYYPWASVGRNFDVGYINGCADPLIRENYLAGGTSIVLKRCSDVTMKHNRFVGRVDPTTASRYRENAFVSERPAEGLVAARANCYQQGRGHIAIFNWDRRPHVALDLSRAGVALGTPFAVHDARDFFGRPIVEGVYRGTAVHLPMDRITRVTWSDTATAGPAEFAALVVLPRGAVDPSHDLPWSPRGRACSSGAETALADARASESRHGDSQ